MPAGSEKPATIPEITVAMGALLRGLRPRRGKPDELVGDYLAVLTGLPLSAIEGAIARFLRGEVPNASTDFAPTPARLAKVARTLAGSAVAGGTPVSRPAAEWKRNPAQTYYAMAMDFGQAVYSPDRWPVISRAENWLQWREWYAYYLHRKLAFSAECMRNKAAKTVPAISPFDFDADFERTTYEYPPVPDDLHPETFVADDAVAKARVQALLATAFGPPKGRQLKPGQDARADTPPPREIPDFSKDKLAISPVLAKQIEERARAKALQAELEGTEFDMKPKRRRKTA